jgi:hypothetical protein
MKRPRSLRRRLLMLARPIRHDGPASNSARERIGHRVTGDRRSLEIHLIRMGPRIIHEDADDIAQLCILKRVGIEKRRAVLIGERRELLDRAHETPALTRIDIRRQKDRAALAMHAGPQSFARAQHLARVFRMRKRSGEEEA